MREIYKISPVTKYMSARLAIRVSFILAICACVTLYLSPSNPKYASALVLILSLISIYTYVNGFKSIDFRTFFLWLWPFIAFASIGLFRLFIVEDYESIKFFIDPMLGFLPFFFFYQLSRSSSKRECFFIVAAVLVIPGLVHWAVMLVDVITALLTKDSSEFFTNHQGILEYFKNEPRVGRRHVSLALVQLLIGGCLISLAAKDARLRWSGYVIAFLALSGLALLDARGAYVSIALGLSIVGFIARKSYALRVRPFRKPSLMFGAAAIAAVVVLVGYESGKSRWEAAAYSAKVAVQDVLRTDLPLSKRSFVDRDIWQAEISAEDLDQCYKDAWFRCAVDQSMYLRVAWLVAGTQAIFEKPLGTGHSPSYLGRRWGVEGMPNKFQRVDNLLIEIGVSFGVVGVFLYLFFWWRLALSLRRELRTGHSTDTLVLTSVACLLFICMSRSFIDLWSQALWGYLLAWFGLYAGIVDRRMSEREIRQTAETHTI
jgi:hypothetical protein